MLNKLGLQVLCWVAGVALYGSCDPANQVSRPRDAAAESPRTPEDLAPQDLATATKPPKCYDLDVVRSLMDKAEQRSEWLQADNSQLYSFILKQNPLLKSFEKKLSSDSAPDRVAIVSYLLFKYPVIVVGEKGRMMHHHRFVVRDASKAPLLKQKLLIDEPDSDLYQFNFADYQNYELSQYDNVRYTWENPYFGTYINGSMYDEDSANRFTGATLRDSGPALVVEHFKNTLDRSPDNLAALYDRFKVPFFTVVSATLYRKLKLDLTVDTLLESYEYFKKQKRLELFDVLAARCFGSPSTGRRRSSIEAVAGGNWRWYYSFWERRKTEGNAEVVLTVLQEVQAHYGKAGALQALCTPEDRPPKEAKGKSTGLKNLIPIF